MISVVCPFYNEESILEGAVRLMVKNLASLGQEWELVIVNDGSLDGSLAVARRMEAEIPQLRVVSYLPNKGRGYALRQGVGAARGELAITTEIDCSWGDDIVHRLVAAFKDHPDADIIVASPHLPGGGYKNVPASRVFLSAMGNHIIRAGLSAGITMNTGMTRAYKRDRFLALPLDENGKEQHLEIISKSLAFGYRIHEISAVLEWKDAKLAKPGATKRKSSSKIPRLIQSHMLFSILVAPFRYLYAASAVLAVIALALCIAGVVRVMHGNPYAYLFLGGISLALFSFLVGGVGILAQQGRLIQTELWRIRSEMRQPPPGRQ
jgi:dolichyl-phosphate beta-glucosyltransferase